MPIGRGRRRHVVRRAKATILVAVLAFLPAAHLAPNVSAHPSDFRTLTIDLLVQDGHLVAIDAAVVDSPGPGYSPFPTIERRHRIAVEVLDAVGLSRASAAIDAENSRLYHEVGFYIGIDDGPRATALHFDTVALQRLTELETLDRLKLSFCEIGPDVPAAELDVQASRPGRPSDPPSSRDRPNCTVWVIERGDPAVAFGERASLPRTGPPGAPLVVSAVVLIGTGSVLLATTVRHVVP